jgi:hypothetical protein
MLVVLLLLPISLAVGNGEFDHHGGGDVSRLEMYNTNILLVCLTKVRR